MGKYLRKAKITGDVEATTLGVLTRARTLALRRLQSSDSCYLQLRSRRFQKPPTPLPHPKNTHSRFLYKVGFSVAPNRGRVTEYVNHFGAQITLDFEPRDRSTRESTPCSLVREADAMVNPGSAARLTDLNATAQRTRNSILKNIPSAHEIEEFFTFAEQQQQRLFMEKYNFDVANDLPLSGRYEWIRVNH